MLAVIGGVAAFVGVVVGILAAFKVGPFSDNDPAHLSLEAQTKKASDSRWSDVTWIHRGEQAQYRIYVANSGDRAARRVLIRLTLPRSVKMISGDCWITVTAGSRRACEAGITREGITSMELGAGDSLEVIIGIHVPLETPGGRLEGKAYANSDDTPELAEQLILDVPVTPAEQAVRNLYRSEWENAGEFWRGRPSLSGRSKRFLIRRWRRLNPDQPHSFDSVPNGRLVTADELDADWRLSGRIVDLSVYVIGEPRTKPLPGRHQAVLQTFFVGVRNGGTLGWCETARVHHHLLHRNDWIWVRGVPYAHGRVDWDGSAHNVTALICPGVRRLG